MFSEVHKLFVATADGNSIAADGNPTNVKINMMTHMTYSNDLHEFSFPESYMQSERIKNILHAPHIMQMAMSGFCDILMYPVNVLTLFSINCILSIKLLLYLAIWLANDSNAVFNKVEMV